LLSRVKSQGKRVHLPVGLVCNNNCLFCMEEDREGRKTRIEMLSDDKIRRVILLNRDAEEICFTSGEPTTHPRLALFISWAKQAGYSRISLMTNGRRLSYAPYTAALVRAGLNRVYISIHGHDAPLHDSLTRSPGSFEQTVSGIRTVVSLRSVGLRVNTSTVLTQRNVAQQSAIYELLCALEVDEAVFNAVQTTGRAKTHLDRVVPRYSEIRRGFDAMLASSSDQGARAILVDVPACITQGLAEKHRGFVENRIHFEALTSEVSGACLGVSDAESSLQKIASEDLHRAFRLFAPSCSRCSHRSICPGIGAGYMEKFGSSEFVAIE